MSSGTNINDPITRVWQYPDKPRHMTITVDTPEKAGRQFDIPLDTPFGQYLQGRDDS